MPLTPGTRLGPYDIVAPLGAGGMGEVYRATDTKLGRDVALKVLPAEMAQDPERLARFRREAKSLAQLDHPNIVTIYSVEESDGVRFLTMQLVEGAALDHLIPAGGLPLEQIVEIASALGDALAAAHDKGIVHRDLKPANVMVSNEGRVKVLDFGLAKDVSATDPADATLTSDHRTRAGMVMGTPAYMSPEQTAGRPLDHRTDIFSLGVVLHEMATGRRPFEGNSSAELISAILRDNPPSITDARPDLPSDLARIVRRCLEKDPRHRVQTARDVSNEFRDLARQTSQKPIPAKASPISTMRAVPAADSGTARADEGFWVAVLPFKYPRSDAALKALAEGLSEEIITGLSRFSYLRVIARGSTAKYSSESGDVRAIGKELGARYVMEGSLRQAGIKLRLAVQLVDTVSGAHLWAETYEHAFAPESVFEVQDDLVPRIVATVADQYGVLPRGMSEVLRSKSEDTLTPHEAVLRTFSYFTRITAEEHAAIRKILERAVREAPEHADSWAMLSMIYRGEFAQGYSPGPDPLDRALAAAQRAVELAPTHALGHYSLAAVYFFRKEMVPFRVEAERAMALNPMDASVKAYLGLLIASSGEWDRGCEIVEAAMQLNPNCPGYFYVARCCNGYRQGKYAEVLEGAARVNMPSYFHTHAMRAAALGQLGRRDEAKKAVQDLLALRPDFAAAARQEYAKWYDSELIEKLIEGLRKAGLEIGDTPAKSVAVKAADSGAARADEGFWVAVLPFRGASGDADLEALADGLTEAVTTGLSRFPYLQVIAHNSATAYKGRSADIRTVGRELGARYVIEGSIRKGGRAIRVTAQLMDAVSGTQLWAEEYDREVSDRERSDRQSSGAGTFQLQDDLTDHIVTSVADGYGVLVRSMAAPTRERKVEELSASELVLRYYAFMQQISPQEHAVLRAGLERALEREPNHATAWACLSSLYQLEYFDRFNPLEKPLERAREAAWRAVKIDPACQMGWKELAAVYFFSRDFTAFRETAERAMSLNPRDGTTLAFMALMIAFSGDWERGMALAQRAIELNRHHPGWYHNIFFHHHYRKGEYESALKAAKKINMAEFHWMHLMTAAACGMLGRHEEARAAIASLRKYNPTFLDLANVREDVEMWDPDKGDLERLLQGLQKAGLKYGSMDSAATDSIATDSVATKIEPDSGTVRAQEVSSLAQGVSGIGRNKIGLAIAAIVLVIGAVGVVAYLKTSKTGQIDSIAVLPLENRSNNADSDYIPDGITESINNSLARLPSLTVIPHSVAFHYKGKVMDVRKVGEELHVQTVLAGSVAERGDDLTINVELDDIRSGKQLWGEQYHRKLADLLAVQSDIAREVSQRLRSQLSVEDQKKLTKGSTENPEAYRLYLKGKYYTDKFTKEGFETGIDYFNQAIVVDPNYGLAYSGLAYNYINQMDWYMSPSEAGPKTKDAAEKALAIDASDARAHLTLAILAHWYDWNWVAAESGFKRTLELNPNDADAYLYYSWFLAPMGRNEEAVAEARRGQRADPLSALGSFDVGGALVFARQWDAAIEQLHRAIELDPNYWFSHCFLGRAYEQKRKFPEAIAEFQRALEIEKDNTEIWSGLGHAYAVSGKKAEAQKVLDHLKELSAHGWVAPYNVAVIYAGLGEKDRAFALLEQAYKDRSYYVATYLATDERLDSLRPDPRFADLKKRVGLP
jgi:TolB-like protein/Tfp pilus assembly protein PilF